VNEELLVAGARKLGLALDRAQIDSFARYLDLLRTWGARINLTAIRDPDQIVTHHFVDSLAVVAALRGRSGRLLDVGSGAGFPGAVCALMMAPALDVTLLDRRQKKAAFLLALRRELGVRYTVLQGDVADVRETFDLVISRAAFPPQEWLAIGAPRVAPGGLLLCMLRQEGVALDSPPGFAESLRYGYEIAGERREIRGFVRA
jgi:16S rRNA (guanine527-N7)-methyltransferase